MTDNGMIAELLANTQFDGCGGVCGTMVILGKPYRFTGRLLTTYRVARLKEGVRSGIIKTDVTELTRNQLSNCLPGALGLGWPSIDFDLAVEVEGEPGVWSRVRVFTSAGTVN